MEADEEPTTTTTSSPARSPGTVVVALVNAARDEAGCEPVTTDKRLSRAAVAHSADMAKRDYFAHLSPEGLSFVQRALQEGYPTPAAENIAMGQRTAKQVMQSWMESEDHRENILDCSLTNVGVGLSTSGWYWTQVFGR
ncbi:hypothetical protein GCM10027563_33110 [Parasphingorhabdus pacifica]